MCAWYAPLAYGQVQGLPPSSVSSLVWAYAKMGHPSAELMERVVSVARR